MPDAPAPGNMTMLETYEWLPGDCFLINRGTITIAGTDPVSHLWVFGYDRSRETYVIRAFDGEGNLREYEANVRDRIWTFAGQWERATLEFSLDGKKFDAHWEIANDGASWSPLCDVTVSKST